MIESYCTEDTLFSTDLGFSVIVIASFLGTI